MTHLSIKDTRWLFLKHSGMEENGRFMVRNKPLRDDVPTFYTDWYRSEFYYRDMTNNIVPFYAAETWDDVIDELSFKQKKSILKTTLKTAFPEVEVSRAILRAYSQSIPMLMSTHILSFTQKVSIFNKALFTGFEHSVKKIFSVKKGKGHLRLENIITGVECKIVGDFIINKEGCFELESPIRLQGKDARFIYALWMDDYYAINKYWPNALDKTVFDNFVNDLDTQLANAKRDLNSYVNAPDGKLKVHEIESGLYESISAFLNATNVAINHNPVILTFKQKLYLTEAIQRITDGIQMDYSMDYARLEKLAQKLLKDKRLYTVGATLLALTAVVVCAGLVAVAISSFGLAPPLVLGAITIASSLYIAIPAMLGALFSAAVAVKASSSVVNAGFFSIFRKNNFIAVGKSIQTLIPELKTAESTLKQREKELDPELEASDSDSYELI